MSSEIYYSPFIPTFNGNGLPVANAVLTFFYTGTTDLAPIFQDSAMTIPMVNPVISDGAARYPNIYMPEEIVYRVRETGPDGTPLAADIDPYYPGQAVVVVPDLPEFAAPGGAALVGFLQSGAGAVARTVQAALLDEPLSLFDFMSNANEAAVRAGTNGSTDFSTTLQALLTECAATGRTGVLPLTPVALRINSAVSISSASLYTNGIRLVGAGEYNTIFDSRVAGPMITLDGSMGVNDVYSAQFCALFKDFAITTGATPAGAGGIKLIANWNAVIDGVRVEGLLGKAIHLDVRSAGNADADLASYIEIRNCRLLSCEYGIYGVPATVGFYSMVQSIIQFNTITNCTLDGIRLAGASGVWIMLNSIQNCGAAGGANTSGGIWLDYDNRTPNNIRILCNELGNGNRAYDIKADGLLNSQLSFNRYVQNNGDPGSIANGIVLGDGTRTVRNVNIVNEQVQVGTTINFNLLQMASNIVPTDNVNMSSVDKFAWTGGTKTLCDAPSRLLFFEEDGKPYRMPVLRRAAVTASGAGTVTPDLNVANFYEITITTAGAVVIAAPSTGAGSVRDGETITFMILNSSGGALNLTFNSGAGNYLTVLPVIADTKRRTVAFRYTPSATQWIQMGDWSADL